MPPQDGIDLSGFGAALSGYEPAKPATTGSARTAPSLQPGAVQIEGVTPGQAPGFLRRSAERPMDMRDALEALEYALAKRDQAAGGARADSMYVPLESDQGNAPVRKTEPSEAFTKAERAVGELAYRMQPMLLNAQGAEAINRVMAGESVELMLQDESFASRAPFDFTEEERRRASILTAEPFTDASGRLVIQNPDDPSTTLELARIPAEKLPEVKKLLYGSAWARKVVDSVAGLGTKAARALGSDAETAPVSPVTAALGLGNPIGLGSIRNREVETPFGTFNYVPDISGDFEEDLARMQDPVYLKSLLAAGEDSTLDFGDHAARAATGLGDFLAVNAALGGVGRLARIGLAARAARVAEGAAGTAQAAGGLGSFFGRRGVELARAQVRNGASALRTGVNADVLNVWEEARYEVLAGLMVGDMDILGNAMSGVSEGAFELGIGRVVRGGNALGGKVIETIAGRLSRVGAGDTASEIAKWVAERAEKVRVGVGAAANRLDSVEQARIARERARSGDHRANAWLRGVREEGDALAARGLEAARAAGYHTFKVRAIGEVWHTMSHGLALGASFGGYQEARAAAARDGQRWDDLTAGQKWSYFSGAFSNPAIWGGVLTQGIMPTAYQKVLNRMPGSFQVAFRQQLIDVLEQNLETMSHSYAARSVQWGKDAEFVHGLVAEADLTEFRGTTADEFFSMEERPGELVTSAADVTVSRVEMGLELEVLRAIPALDTRQMRVWKRKLDALPAEQRTTVANVRAALRNAIGRRRSVADERLETQRAREQVRAQGQAERENLRRSEEKARRARAADRVRPDPANTDLSTAAIPATEEGVSRGDRIRTLRDATKGANLEALNPYFIQESPDSWRVRRRAARIVREIDGPEARYYVDGAGQRELKGPNPEGYASLEAAMRAAIVYTDPLQGRPGWEMPRSIDLEQRQHDARKMGGGKPFRGRGPGGLEYGGPDDGSPIPPTKPLPSTLRRGGDQEARKPKRAPQTPESRLVDTIVKTGRVPFTSNGQPVTLVGYVKSAGGLSGVRGPLAGDVRARFGDARKGGVKLPSGVYRATERGARKGITLEGLSESLASDYPGDPEFSSSETETFEGMDPSELLDRIEDEAFGGTATVLPEFRDLVAQAMQARDAGGSEDALLQQARADGYESVEEAMADAQALPLETPEGVDEVWGEIDASLPSGPLNWMDVVESALPDEVHLEERREVMGMLDLDIPGLTAEDRARLEEWAHDPERSGDAVEELAKRTEGLEPGPVVKPDVPVIDSAEAVEQHSKQVQAELDAAADMSFGDPAHVRAGGDALHPSIGKEDSLGEARQRDSRWIHTILAARLAMGGRQQAESVAVGMLLEVAADPKWFPFVQAVSGLSKADVEGLRDRLLEMAEARADGAIERVKAWAEEAGFAPFTETQLAGKGRQGNMTLRQLLGLLSMRPPTEQTDARTGRRRNVASMVAEMRGWAEKTTQDRIEERVGLGPAELENVLDRLDAAAKQTPATKTGQTAILGLLQVLNGRVRTFGSSESAVAPNGQVRPRVIDSLWEALTGAPPAIRVGNQANKSARRKMATPDGSNFKELSKKGWDPAQAISRATLSLRQLVEDLSVYGTLKYGELDPQTGEPVGEPIDWVPLIDPFDVLEQMDAGRAVLRSLVVDHEAVRDAFLQMTDPYGRPAFESEAQGRLAWSRFVARAREVVGEIQGAFLYAAWGLDGKTKGSRFSDAQTIFEAMGDEALALTVAPHLRQKLEGLGLLLDTSEGPRLDANAAQALLNSFADRAIAKALEEHGEGLGPVAFTDLTFGAGPLVGKVVGLGLRAVKAAVTEFATTTDPTFETGIGSPLVRWMLRGKERVFASNKKAARVLRKAIWSATGGGRIIKKAGDFTGEQSVLQPSRVARANRAFREHQTRVDAVAQAMLGEFEQLQTELDTNVTLDESVAISTVVSTDGLRRLWSGERWSQRFPGMTPARGEYLLELTRKIVRFSDRLAEWQRANGPLSDEQVNANTGRWVVRALTRSGEEAQKRDDKVRDYSRGFEALADPMDTTLNRVMDMRVLLPNRAFEAVKETQMWHLFNKVRRDKRLWMTAGEYDEAVREQPWLAEMFTKVSTPGTLTEEEARVLSQTGYTVGEKSVDGKEVLVPLPDEVRRGQEEQKRRLLEQRRDASMDQVTLSLWARDQRNSTETEQERQEALRAVEAGQPRRGRKQPMTRAKRQILDMIENGYMLRSVHRDLALELALNDRTLDVLEEAVQQWKRVQTVLAPRFWIANIGSSVLSNHATRRLGAHDFVLSLATGRGFHAEAARAIERYRELVDAGAVSVSLDGDMEIDPSLPDYSTAKVTALAMHYLGNGTWQKTMPGGLGATDMVDLFGTAGRFSALATDPAAANRLAGAVRDMAGRQTSMVKGLADAWHRAATGGTTSERAEAQLAVFRAHQEMEALFKLAATLAALRKVPTFDAAGHPLPLDRRVREAVALGAEGTVNYANRNDFVARHSQNMRVRLSPIEARAAKERGVHPDAGALRSSAAQHIGRAASGLVIGRPFLSYAANMLPTAIMATATSPIGAMLGSWMLLMGAQWFFGQEEEEERRRKRDLEGQRGGRDIEKRAPGDPAQAPLLDEDVRRALEPYADAPVNMGTPVLSKAQVRSRGTIGEAMEMMRELSVAGPFNPNLGYYAAPRRLGETGFYDASLYLDFWSMPGKFNQRMREIGRAFTEGRWELLLTNDTALGTAPAMGVHTMNNLLLAWNGKPDQGRAESLVRSAKALSQTYIPGMTGAWPLSSNFTIRAIEDHMDARLEDAVSGINRVAAMARTEGERNLASVAQFGFPIRVTPSRSLLSNRSWKQVFDRAVSGMGGAGAQPDFGEYEKGAKVFHRSLMQQLELSARQTYTDWLRAKDQVISPYAQVLHAAFDVAPDLTVSDGRIQLVSAPSSSLGKFLQTQMGDDPLENELKLEMMRAALTGAAFNRTVPVLIDAAEDGTLGEGEFARLFAAGMQFSQSELVEWVYDEVVNKRNRNHAELAAMQRMIMAAGDVRGRAGKLREKLSGIFGDLAESTPFYAEGMTGEEEEALQLEGARSLSRRPEAPDRFEPFRRALGGANR